MLLEQHLDLIRKIVWSYVKKHPGLEFDDLFSEVCIVCLEAERDFLDEEISNASTFFWKVADNHLKTLLNRACKSKSTPWDFTESEPTNDYNPSVEEEFIARENWQEIFSSLSPEAKRICKIIFEETKLYLPTDKPRKCRGIIAKALKSRNWSGPAIWRGFREIKQALR